MPEPIHDFVPNIRGPGSTKSVMLNVIVLSILLYGTPIYSDVLRMNEYHYMMIFLQKRGALIVISACRTVSAQSALVVAGMVPVDLVAEELKSLQGAGDG